MGGCVGDRRNSRTIPTVENLRGGSFLARTLIHIGVVLNFFFSPCWRHGMARMAIRVSGQRQKHGASLADDIAKWLLRFSGSGDLATAPPSTSPQRTSWAFSEGTKIIPATKESYRST